jgi:Family of unknown function (DUF6173)
MTSKDDANPLFPYLSKILEPGYPYTGRLPVLPAPDQNLASEFQRRLVEWITDYDKSLDDAHEVGVKLVSFGQSITFRLYNVGYWNPSLMRFYGISEDGSPVELIQHVSQISILLMTLPRQNPSKPKRPIGFDPPPTATSDST